MINQKNKYTYGYLVGLFLDMINKKYHKKLNYYIDLSFFHFKNRGDKNESTGVCNRYY